MGTATLKIKKKNTVKPPACQVSGWDHITSIFDLRERQVNENLGTSL